MKTDKIKAAWAAAVCCLVIVCCASCVPSDKGEKRQGSRNKVVNVKDRVKEIDTGDVLIGSLAEVYVFGENLVVGDYKSADTMIHVFDKNTFRHVCSFGERGQGPREITVLGTVAWNESERDFYVTDFGQHRILRYNLDSLLNDSLYAPTVKLRINDAHSIFPIKYHYVNDTLSYGSFSVPPVSPAVRSSHRTAGRWNMKTGETKLIDYVNPPSDKHKRIIFAVSPEHDRLVECNMRYDLISLYNLDGELQCDVYGPQWVESGDGKAHFLGVAVLGDKIIASYIGEDWQRNDGARKFHVFSMSGDYLKTLDVGYEINRFCCDEENRRIIMNLDSEIQFGYLDLDGLI